MSTFSDNLARDSSANPIQTGSTILTVDASNTPKASPFSLTGGNDAFVVPENCIELIVNPSANLQVSEDSALAHYDVVAANTKEAIPCANAGTIYLKGSGTVNFRFTKI